MSKELETIKAENAALKAELEEAKKVIAEQAGKLQNVKVEEEAKAPVITIGKQKFKVAIQKFRIDGVLKTLEDLKNDKDLQEKLVKEESPVLVKI